MAMEEMSLREFLSWAEGAGLDALDRDSSREAWMEAGWKNWECDEGELSWRLERILGILDGVTDAGMLDGYGVWFMNEARHGCEGATVDSICFWPLDYGLDGKQLVLKVDELQEYMYVICTSRSSYAVEDAFMRLDEALAFINGWDRKPEEEGGL